MTILAQCTQSFVVQTLSKHIMVQALEQSFQTDGL